MPLVSGWKLEKHLSINYEQHKIDKQLICTHGKIEFIGSRVATIHFCVCVFFFPLFSMKTKNNKKTKQKTIKAKHYGGESLRQYQPKSRKLL